MKINLWLVGGEGSGKTTFAKHYADMSGCSLFLEDGTGKKESVKSPMENIVYRNLSLFTLFESTKKPYSLGAKIFDTSKFTSLINHEGKDWKKYVTASEKIFGLNNPTRFMNIYLKIDCDPEYIEKNLRKKGFGEKYIKAAIAKNRKLTDLVDKSSEKFIRFSPGTPRIAVEMMVADYIIENY